MQGAFYSEAVMDEAGGANPKLLTSAEANALLPKVRELALQLKGLYHSIVKTNNEMDEVIAKLTAGNGYPISDLKSRLEELTKHQLQLIEAYQSAVAQLEDLGGLLKDAEKGLIDFYTLHDDQVAFLCWHLGEERVEFWHTLEEGFSGRKPLK